MAEVARLTAFGVFMAPTAASRKHCAWNVKLKSDHNTHFRKRNSASQNASTNIPGEKREKWLSYFLHKLKLSNGTKDSWLLNKTVKIIHDARLSTTKYICSSNKMKRITFTWMITSNLNHNAIKWKKLHSPYSNHRAFHLLTSYFTVVRRKVCDERRGLRAYLRNPSLCILSPSRPVMPVL